MVGLFTAASRVLGMIRDQLIAGRLGTSLEASAFVLAFTVPNLFRRLFGEGALSASFLPRFLRCRDQEGVEAAWGLARRVSSVIAAGLFSVCALAVATAWLLPHLLPGLGPKARLVLELSQWMLPYTVFICLAAIAMGVLNALHHYATPAAAQLVLNVVLILTLLVLCPLWADGGASAQVRVMAAAVLVAGVVQLGMQLPPLLARGWRPGWEPALRDPTTRAVLVAMAPAAAAAAVTQLNLLLDRFLAGFVGPHAPAALYFSERLLYLPLGIFAVAAAQVLLPAFSRLAARDDTELVREKTGLAVSMMAFVMLPAGAGLIALALPITRMLYGFGEFSEASVHHTAAALAAYAPGLLVFSLDKVFVPVFLAHRDTRTPLRAGLVAVLTNLGLNLLCLWTLPTRLAVAGLAGSTVLAHGLYILLLARGAHRQFGNCGWGRVLGAFLRCGLAALAMGTCAWAVQQGLESRVAPGKTGQVISTLGAILTGMGVYVALAAGLRFPEWQLVRGKLRR